MDFLIWTLDIAQGLVALGRELLLTIAAALSVVVVWRQAHREE
jgi:hypothetical protein